MDRWQKGRFHAIQRYDYDFIISKGIKWKYPQYWHNLLNYICSNAHTADMCSPCIWSSFWETGCLGMQVSVRLQAPTAVREVSLWLHFRLVNYLGSKVRGRRNPAITWGQHIFRWIYSECEKPLKKNDIHFICNDHPLIVSLYTILWTSLEVTNSLSVQTITW